MPRTIHDQIFKLSTLLLNLLNTSAIMSAFHITDQDLQKEESRFGSKNADVSAMKVRYFPPLVSYNKDYRVY